MTSSPGPDVATPRANVYKKNPRPRRSSAIESELQQFEVKARGVWKV